MPDDDAPVWKVWKVLVVMCPDEGCMRDLQVAVDDADDASKVVSCPFCGTKLYVSLPAVPD